MQLTITLLTAIIAAASTHAQPFAAVIDRYTQQGCIPFDNPGAGQFILNPTRCNFIPDVPGTRSIILKQIFPGCNISLYQTSDCSSGGPNPVIPNITVADPTPSGCKTLNSNFLSYAAVCV